MPFVNNNLGVLNLGFPDVCLTPMPVPVPIPYPNIQMSAVAIPTQFTTFVACMPAHNLTTMMPISLGDQAGVNLGVASGLVMGPVRHIMGSFTVFVGGPPVTKMLNMTGHNGGSPNIPGVSLTPGQVTTIVLS